MSNNQNPAAGDDPCRVEIRVRGRINQHWSEWFEDLTITYTKENETVLLGPVADQAALYGLLAKLGALGLPLLSLKQIEGKE